MTTFTLPLNAGNLTLAIAGGKGANLSLVSRAGFPVPPGFVVTTDAYRSFVEANDLQRRIVDLAKDLTQTSERRSAAIRQIFADAIIPGELADALALAHTDLTQTDIELALAVRSSATAEDLPGASFAGQQDTYLNVRGPTALLEAVQRCWSSLWTPRALEYRARQGLDPSTVSIAVLVQVMVPAQASGIMFTANPISGARDEIVVHAAWGLGEAIVGGLVTPDQVIVDKPTGAIKQITIADKMVMTQPAASGTQERPVEESQRHAMVLEPAQAAGLARMGQRIEECFGEPQDIEWCFTDGKFFIVQARPITALPSQPVKWENPVAGAKWLKDLQAAEWATEPLSPLGATTTFPTMIAARQHKLPMQRFPWYALINGWLYIRADFRVIWLPVALGGLLWSIFARTMDGDSRMRRTWPARLAILDSVEQVNMKKLADAELQARAAQLLGHLAWWWWEVTWYAAGALLGEQLIVRLQIPGLSDPGALFRGNDSLLLEAERTLHHAAGTGDAGAYLSRFGHFVESADPIHLTLRESPGLLGQQMAAARRSELSSDERLLRTRRERTEAEHFVQSLGGPRGFGARLMLRLGQGYAAHTDDAVFHFQRVLALLRGTFLEVGRRLAEARVIAQEEDVFYLEYRELWEPPQGDVAGRVSTRRRLREIQKRLAPPSFIPPLSDPAWVSDLHVRFFASALGETAFRRGAQDRNGRTVLVGTPSSPGRARGIARVITGPNDFHRFQPGDVLIAHTTTPVWTPLFNIAGAAVTEVGGPFSHAAIVAREFGIPLVTGAVDATRVMPDGTMILVDGSAGIVEM